MSWLKNSVVLKISGWRPSGIPSDDITGHLQPVMLENEENLNRLRNRLEAEMEASNCCCRCFSTGT